ncbi:MAG TPA: nuclear transport factor 2 family protein [Thermoleophilaceae bacterium]|nr:nuclear transport factor 2 family protein [Thermoleophilaceae bacterium]
MSSPGEVVRTFLERYAAGDRDCWRRVFAEDIVWDVSRDQIPGEPTYHGHDGVERFFVEWLGAWEGYEFEQLELLESGPYVMSVFRQSGRGKGSGIDIDRTFHGVYEVRDGLVVSYTGFARRDEALEATGLS